VTVCSSTELDMSRRDTDCSACHLPLSDFFLGLLFLFEYEGSTYVRNVCQLPVLGRPTTTVIQMCKLNIVTL
jgi:hypothetical protein